MNKLRPTGTIPTPITKDWLKQQIADTKHVKLSERLRHCTLTLHNGFQLTGEGMRMPQTPDDPAIGREVALEAALEKAWVLYGFLNAERTAAQAESTYASRMLVEHETLAKNIHGLSSFLSQSKPKDVSLEQWQLMKAQLAGMKDYFGALDARVALLPK